MHLLPPQIELFCPESSTTSAPSTNCSNYNYYCPQPQQIVPKGFKMNDNSISSAIFIACERGALAQLKQLVHGCRIQLDNVFNELGESPLHVACGNGFQELVAFLIELGADPALEDGRGDTALIWAARNGHAHLFNTFILSPVLINATNSIGETALHLATRYAQGQAVLSLLERGADPQLQDKHGETPLHIAAWDGQSGLLDLLCRFCVELNFTNLVLTFMGAAPPAQRMEIFFKSLSLLKLN